MIRKLTIFSFSAILRNFPRFFSEFSAIFRTASGRFFNYLGNIELPGLSGLQAAADCSPQA